MDLPPWPTRMRWRSTSSLARSGRHRRRRRRCSKSSWTRMCCWTSWRRSTAAGQACACFGRRPHSRAGQWRCACPAWCCVSSMASSEARLPSRRPRGGQSHGSRGSWPSARRAAVRPSCSDRHERRSALLGLPTCPPWQGRHPLRTTSSSRARFRRGMPWQNAPPRARCPRLLEQ